MPSVSLFLASLRRDGSVADSMAVDSNAEVCQAEDVSNESTLRSLGENEDGMAIGMSSEACL